MLPEEYTKGSQPDLNDRIGQSLIEYKGEPIWVYQLKAASGGPGNVGKIVRAYTLPKWVNVDNIPLDDPDLSVTAMSAKLGYFNVDDRTLAALVRIPMRSKVQGINPRSTGINIVTPVFSGLTECPVPSMSNIPQVSLSASIVNQGPTSVVYNVWRQLVNNFVSSNNWGAILATPAFTDSYRGLYPSVTTAMNEKPQPHITAVHRRYAVSQDEFGDRFLIHKGYKVAKFFNSRLRYIPAKAYLAGDVERELNILPV